jgi:phosphoenolpyruvate phosphomutase
VYTKSTISNSTRVGILRKQLKQNKFVRIIEVHNGISSLIVSNIQVLKDTTTCSFDGFWESSLTDSASKGLPDMELVSSDSRIHTIQQIMDVTSKPMIVDGDTGGDINHFEYLVRRLERAGVSMVIIEDKIFPKRNSLLGTNHNLEEISVFARKIRRGVASKQNKDFMIIARLEGLIAGGTVDDAIIRAKAFLKAGADGIMIHSKSSAPDEIIAFARAYKNLPKSLTRGKALVCVPTTYHSITATELAKEGFNVIIYANHLLRSAYLAMEEVCKNILTFDRSTEVEQSCISINKLSETVGMLEIIQKDKEVEET